MMTIRSTVLTAFGVAAGAFLPFYLAAQPPAERPVPPAAAAPQDPIPLPPRQGAPPSQEGVRPQARGPVHEAFAQPTPTKPQAGPVIPKKAPEPIPEQPPDQKPEGENVKWIPGYWSWDSEQTDFVWVSGFWRVPPPDRRWVPGYWTQAGAGSQWVPGFWAPTAQADLQYLPAPPPSVDSGPSVPAPDGNSLYVPGSWVYDQDSYVWQPGYWGQGREDYIYNPSYYSWTPSGYVLVNGYWDYPLADRGLLFAPVTFDQPYWQTPGWCYRPFYCVGVGSLLDSLFCQPSWNRYCFGDYYSPGYASQFGIYPWIGYGPRFRDPLFGFYNWRNRGNPGWFGGQRDRFWGRHDGLLARPPHTLAEQHQLFAGAGVRDRVASQNLRMLVPLTQVNQDARANHAAAISRAVPELPTGRPNRVVSPGPRPAATPFSTRGPSVSNRLAPNGPVGRPMPRTGLPAQRSVSSFAATPHVQPPQIYNVTPRGFSSPAAAHYQAPATHYRAPAMHSAPAMHYSAPHYSPAPASHGGGGFHGGGGHASGGSHGGGGHKK